MVFQVVVLEEPGHRVAHRKVVRRIVDIVIDQVADDKKGAERLDPGLRDEQAEQQVQHHHDGNGAGGRHHQPGLVFRVLMVVAVKQEHQPLAQLAFRREVKQEAVQAVLGERPGELAGHSRWPVPAAAAAGTGRSCAR